MPKYEPSRHKKMMTWGMQMLLRGQRTQYFMHEPLSSSPVLGGVQHMKFQYFGIRDWGIRNLDCLALMCSKYNTPQIKTKQGRLGERAEERKWEIQRM